MTAEFSMCAIHEMAEMMTGDTFQACPHCGHVYHQASDVVEAYNESEADYAEKMDVHPSFLTLAQVDLIDECPLCHEGW